MSASCQFLSFVNFNKFSSLCYNNFCTKTDTGNKIKHYRLPNNTEAQQENIKENIT